MFARVPLYPLIWIFLAAVAVAIACAPAAPHKTLTAPAAVSPIAAAPAAAIPTWAAPSADNPALAAPAEPTLSVEPGTTKVTARWNPVTDAASYQVRWRHQGADFAADSLATVADPVATFTVAEQGLWVVRVQACNDSGCGRPGTATASVIINISGHQSLRFWHDDAGFQLDWDALPGHYIVKYRTSTDNTKWKSSPPLAQPGYTLTGDDFTDFSRAQGVGHPIIRVFFNCNAEGERCALLGRYPNTTMEELPPLDVRAGPPPDPYAAAGADDSASRLIADPLTYVLRPAADFTITTEMQEWDGEMEPFECVERPAVNRWERAHFGHTVKKCSSSSYGVTNDLYIWDQDAVFPDGAICGERPARDDAERRDFGGDTVKVCNAHPDEVDQDKPTSNNGVTGATHTPDHHVRWASARWPALHSTDYDPDNMRCKNGEEHNRKVYPVPLLPDYRYTTTVTVRWCYHYRSHIDSVQTIGSATVTSVPSVFQRRVLYGFQFCGWQPGIADYRPQSHNNRYPIETLWHYVHPVVRSYLPWRYTSEVTPWYENVGDVERNRYQVATSATRPCETEWFRNATTTIADWEGRTSLRR